MVMVKAYQKYKDAKLTWLEKVPECWQILRGKTVFRCIDMRSKDGSEELLSVSSKDGVVPRSSKKITMFMAESYAGYKLCWPGDLVINSLWAWMFGLGFSRHHGIVSSAYGVYRTRSQYLDHWQYFDYLIRSKAYAWELRVRSRGVWTSRLQMTDDRFLDMPILIPPKEEAIEIVKFLSVLDIQIRRYIREKQKVIKLLNEQKQAVINRAITKGVDPSVRLKLSGIDWIGDIPEHWKMKKMKQIVTLIVSNVDKHSFPEETAVRLCNYTDVYKNETITPDMDFMKATATLDEIARFKLKIGDVVITKDSEEWTDIAVPALINYEADDFVCGYHLAILRPNKEAIQSEYLLKTLQSSVIAVQFHIAANGVTRYGLSHQNIKDVLIPVPSIQEQKRIVAYIAERTSGFQKMIIDTNKEIDLIREYRTRLISDAVTGKIDVRGIKLPEIEDITDSEQIEEREILEDVEDTEEVVNADE